MIYYWDKRNSGHLEHVLLLCNVARRHSIISNISKCYISKCFQREKSIGRLEHFIQQSAIITQEKDRREDILLLYWNSTRGWRTKYPIFTPLVPATSKGFEPLNSAKCLWPATLNSTAPTKLNYSAYSISINISIQ